MSDPYWQEEGITLYRSDCREVLAALEPESVSALRDFSLELAHDHGRFVGFHAEIGRDSQEKDMDIDLAANAPCRYGLPPESLVAPPGYTPPDLSAEPVYEPSIGVDDSNPGLGETRFCLAAIDRALTINETGQVAQERGLGRNANGADSSVWGQSRSADDVDDRADGTASCLSDSQWSQAADVVTDNHAMVKHPAPLRTARNAKLGEGLPDRPFANAESSSNTRAGGVRPLIEFGCHSIVELSFSHFHYSIPY